jgi:hypothetical protein
MNLSIAQKGENMKYIWRFRSLGVTRYELVLLEDGCFYGERACWAPGYVSSNIRDILEASWYLNTGFRGHLTDRTMRLLDSFAEQSEKYKVTAGNVV